MATIRLERVPIQVANLGWFGFDHLHVALQQDDLVINQDRWYVMEGLRDTSQAINRLGVLGTDGTTTLSEANGNLTGDELTAALGTPAWRGSNIISFSGFEFEKWFEMVRYANEFEAQQFPYIGYANPFGATATINSTSVIASLLYYVGIDITQYFPTTLRISPGWDTLLGTTGDDELTLEGSFRYIYGGSGDDILKGKPANLLPEKLFGGEGDDTFIATSGVNYYNGGEYGLDYVNDGTDTVTYVDIGVVTINVNRGASPHASPDYYVIHSAGIDQYYSIEVVAWDDNTDKVNIGPGIEFIEEPIKLKLGGQASLDQGDHVDFSTSETALLVNSDSNGDTVVQAASAAGSDIGIWLESVEWLTGSLADDKIYAAPGLRGVDGGGGNDLIDARLATAFESSSPREYDIELSGGDGDDTIIGNSGLTILSGGAGADRFILPALSDPEDYGIELVIEDATAEDRIFVPYNFFNMSGEGIEGSALFPLLGAMANAPGRDSFDDLPHAVGSPTPGAQANGDFFQFRWQLEDQRFQGSDETQGVIQFTGAIHYNRFGNDLLIHLYMGEPLVVTEDGNDEQPWTHSVNTYDVLTEAIIHVTDFEEGDLGIFFHDPGTRSEALVATDHGVYQVFSYSNWDTAVQAMTKSGAMEGPIEERPEAPQYNPHETPPPADPFNYQGTDGDDLIIALEGPARMDGGAGDDTMEGSAGNDDIDGGTGSDTMSGEAGNDVYRVDSQSDVVFERAGGGLDRIITSVSYALPEFVEDIVLFGAALTGTGNAQNNTLHGSDANNTLTGLDGDDVLIGGAGNDLLECGEGSDTYIYVLGDGDDTIRDTGTGGEDMLVLDGALPEDVSMFRLAASPSDVYLALSEGGRILLESFDGPAGSSVDLIGFSTGETWSRAELEAMAEAAPVLANDTPTARDDIGFIAASGTVVVPSADLMANDRAPIGGAISIAGVSGVSAGASVTLRPDGNLTLVTAEGYEGPVTFTYSVIDTFGGTSSAEVEIYIIPNYAPVVSQVLTDQNAAPGAAWSFVVPGDTFTDPDFDALSISASLEGGDALPAWLAFDSATQTFSGTPPAGTTGALDLVITASDGLAETSTTLRVTIGAQNQAPVAGSDSFTTRQNEAIVIAGLALLANDTDGDGDTLSLVSVGAAVNGSVQLLPNGDVEFTPDAGFEGTATFAYDVSDGHGGAATGAVSVDVRVVAGQTIVGTNRSETLIGTSGNDTIEGRGGRDILIGNAGDDVFLISGNDGLDMFDGGEGYDIIRGSSGDDVIGISGGQSGLISIEAIDGGDGYDTLRLTPEADVLDLSQVVLTSIEEIRGRANDDVIIGSAGDDVIRGDGGSDTLLGGDGNDTFLVVNRSGLDEVRGGAGYDRILGSSGDDVFRFRTVEGNLDGIEAIDGGGGIDRIQMTGDADVLDLSGIAVSGIASIKMGGGDDRFVSSTSDDVIFGGAGADEFVFRTGFGHDVIADFQRGPASRPVIDVIDLTDLAFASFNDLMAHATADGNDTLISIDEATSLRIANVALTSLQENDFRL